MPEELILVDWVWEKWAKGAIFDVVDSRLGGEYNETEVVIAVKLGLLCSNNSPELRPTMRQAVRYLDGEVPLPTMVMSPDSHDKRKSATKNTANFEDFVNSYSTSYLDKVSAWSSTVGDCENDLEAASHSPKSPFSGGDAC
ncbi:hypothetical protein MLD38_008733 [Melastoma candidum]|nr:hypothetical protein MLD38_008733 [Melastoma candidum]